MRDREARIDGGVENNGHLAFCVRKVNAHTYTARFCSHDAMLPVVGVALNVIFQKNE